MVAPSDREAGGFPGVFGCKPEKRGLGVIMTRGVGLA
jgi:hypothetical protein